MTKIAKTPSKTTVVKKAATSKKVKNEKVLSQIPTKQKSEKREEFPAWNSIHIFGYGETQLIGHDINRKSPNEKLKTLKPIIENLVSFQQKGTKISLEDTHTINIFNNGHVDFFPLSSKNKTQRFPWADLDAKRINKLFTELQSDK
jgi:hypothetical protein